jgi:hypothetical protein
VRAIVIASVVLVAVTAGVTQTAREAPRPMGVARKTGYVGGVACGSTKSCAAIGEWLYTYSSGRWLASATPAIAHTGGTTLLSLSCPAAGRCEAVGLAGEQRVVHVSEKGRQWSLGEVDLPSDAATFSTATPTGPIPSLPSVSCASAGNCAAVGRYFGTDQMFHPLLDTEDGGTWGAGAEVKLPANADASLDPNQPLLGGSLSLVSCPASGSCTAVGSYTNKDAGHNYEPWVMTEGAGQWAPGSEALLPPDAAVRGNIDVGPSPFFGFTGLSCPSAGNCTAVGGYEDKNEALEGLILTEHEGVWSQAMRAPLPPRAIPNNSPNEFITPITSLSCATPDDCSAVGWYVVANLGKQHGWLLSERNGKWKASAVALPAKEKASDPVILNSVDCPSRGNCVAVGEYYPVAGQSTTHGLIVRERGGKWERAVNAALPKNAAAGISAHAFLSSLSCPSANACTVVGRYKDRSSRPQGLLLSLKLR